MKISIHQPSYWPWLGLLNKIALSEKFIILNNVEISKGTYQYRNTFLCNDKAKFITLPIEYHSKSLLKDIRFKNDNWKEQQLSYIKNYYKKADYFLEIYSAIEKLYQEYQSDDACSFIISTMIQSFIFFDIKVEIKKASDYVFNEKKGELVLEICKYFGADIYVSGQGAKSYMDYAMLDKFTESGIKIEWQTFIHPGYYQGSELLKFVEGLSCLDILFHNGIEKSKEIFKLSSFRCVE